MIFTSKYMNNLVDLSRWFNTSMVPFLHIANEYFQETLMIEINFLWLLFQFITQLDVIKKYQLCIIILIKRSYLNLVIRI